MGYCPDCERVYDASDIVMSPCCGLPLWPCERKEWGVSDKAWNDPGGHSREEYTGHAEDLKKALNKVYYMDMVVVPNASYAEQDTEVIHFRSMGCWCHPEVQTSEYGSYLVHHSETRN